LENKDNLIVNQYGNVVWKPMPSSKCHCGSK